MPVEEGHAFVFTESGRPGPRARSLKEFVGLLSIVAADRIAGHLRRNDFSRWIEEVLRDRELASHLRKIEAQVDGDDRHIVDRIGQAIRARYETTVQ